MDLRLCGLIILSISVICGTQLLFRFMENKAQQDTAWITAFTQRGEDRNEAERKEWIAANCELAAQVEQLKASVADLTCENDRMRDLLRCVKLADVKKVKDQEGKSKDA